MCAMLDRRLDHVVAVAHCGSFTRAAERVGMSQSGMTKSIADLERELGYPLFFRTRRGATPTEDGQRFVAQASRLLSDAHLLLGRHAPGARAAPQPLRIGVCPASLQWLLTPCLGQLAHDHPNARVEMVASEFKNIAQMLETGALDIALGFERDFAERGELQRQRLTTMHPILFVRQGHPLLDGRRVDDAELSEWIFITPSESRPYGTAVRALFADSLKWQHHLHIVDYFPAVRRMVAQSDAIGVTTPKFAASAAFRAAYAVVPGANPLPSADICCATRARWEPSSDARAMLRMLRTQVPAEVGA